MPAAPNDVNLHQFTRSSVVGITKLHSVSRTSIEETTETVKFMTNYFT